MNPITWTSMTTGNLHQAAAYLYELTEDDRPMVFIFPDKETDGEVTATRFNHDDNSLTIKMNAGA